MALDGFYAEIDIHISKTHIQISFLTPALVTALTILHPTLRPFTVSVMLNDGSSNGSQENVDACALARIDAPT